MTSGRKAPTGPPASAGVLAKYVQAYARANGIAEGRVRAWISYMITAGVLQRATAGGQPPFIVKGGVALELRLRNRARASKGINLALRLPDADLALTLERALTGDPYQGFSFRRKREPLLLDNGVVNMEFAVSYRGGTWPASPSISRAANPAKLTSSGSPPSHSPMRSEFQDPTRSPAYLSDSISRKNSTV